MHKMPAACVLLGILESTTGERGNASSSGELSRPYPGCSRTFCADMSIACSASVLISLGRSRDAPDWVANDQRVESVNPVQAAGGSVARDRPRSS